MKKRKNIKPDTTNMGNNPFNDAGFIITANTAREGDKFVLEDGLLVPSYYNMENEDIVKFYTSASNRKTITLLSGGALRLFMWIVYEIDYGKDLVWINRKRYMGESQITSVNTFKRSIEELERYCLIHSTKKEEVFWINPRYLFKGSRMKKYSNRVKR